MPFIILFTYKYLFEKNGNYCYFSFYLKGRKKALCKSTLILSKLQRKYGAGGNRQPYFGSSSNLVVISFLFQLSSSFLILLKVVDMFAF